MGRGSDAAAAIGQPKDLARAKGKLARLRDPLVHAAIVDHCLSSDTEPRGKAEGRRGSGQARRIPVDVIGMLTNECAARENDSEGGNTPGF